MIRNYTCGKNRRVPDPLRVATETATAVGDLLRARWSTVTHVRHKGPVDLVTDADLAAEQLALRMLREAFPEHAIIAEEAGAQTMPGADCWYVDPLDGTTNFAHRYPHIAVSIALTHNGEPVVGVVFDPLRQELFDAVRGGGAHLNGTAIHVSTTSSLDEGLLATGFPYDRRERASFYLRYFEHFLRRSQGVRRGGCAALDLCYVASARLDGFWEWHLKPWDTAAGSIIVTEAGGLVSDFRNAPFRPGGSQILASNGPLHRELLREMRVILQQE